MTTRQFVPTRENISDLLLFVAFMFARVPVWRENLDKVAAQTAKKLHKGFARDKEAFRKICVRMARGVENAAAETATRRRKIFKR